MNALLALIAAILSFFTGGRVAQKAAQRDQPGYFSPQYRAHMVSPQWRALRMRVLASTLGRDVLFPFLPARQVDHLSYARMGHERVWLDVVPLNPATHRLVTMLRDAGLRGPINTLLRLACLGWLLAYILVASIVVAVLLGHGSQLAALLLAAARHVV